jgi:N-acetylglutamate synthase-like GNAT family acetyltransferase
VWSQPDREPPENPSRPIIRAAQPNDNAALLSLLRACPMAADISLLLERDPDFFALGRARGDAQTLVVESDGTIFGCVSTWRRRGWLATTPTDFGYFGDLRIHPDYRRRGGGRGLARAVTDQIAPLPPSVTLTTVASGNRAMDALVTQFAQGRTVKRLARFTSWQLLPIWRLATPAALEIGPAEAGDENQLTDLLDDFHRLRNFAPVFSNGGLRSLVGCSSGMALSDYLIARRRGRIVAALAVWDASAVKRTRVVGLPLGLRGMFAMGRALSHLAPLPPFPAPGDMLRFRFIRHPAYRDGEQDALAGLVRHAVNAARSRRDHFILFTCADDDPLRSSVEGIPRSTYHYGLWGGSNRPDASVPLPEGWCFDDAALA